MEFARRHTTDPVRIAAVSTVTPSYPNTVIEMPNFSTDSAVGAGDNVVRLLPPLIITEDDVDDAMGRLDSACQHLTGDQPAEQVCA